MLTSLLSMLLVLFFVMITIIILVPIFKEQKMDISQTSLPLSIVKFNDLITCDTCVTLTLEDSINLIDGFQYVIYEKNNTLAHCES